MTRTITGKAFDQERLRLARTAILRAFVPNLFAAASYSLEARNSRLNETAPHFLVTRTVNSVNFGAL